MTDNDAAKALERLNDLKYPLGNAKRCLHMKALLHSDKEDDGKEPQFVRISMQEYYDIANCIQFLDAKAETIRAALAKSAKVDEIIAVLKDALKLIPKAEFFTNAASIHKRAEAALQRFNGEV